MNFRASQDSASTGPLSTDGNVARGRAAREQAIREIPALRQATAAARSEIPALRQQAEQGISTLQRLAERAGR